MFFPKIILTGVSVAGIAGTVFIFDPSLFRTNDLKQENIEKQNDESIQKQESNSNDQLQENVEKAYEYLVVKASKINNDLNEKLIINETTKNYRCLITKENNEKEIFDNCQLYSLNKSSDSWNKELEKNKPLEGKEYVLKINSENYASLTQETKEIKIIKKDSESEFVTLTEINKLNNENEKFKTNVIVAKVLTIGTQTISDEINEFKLKTKDDSEQIDCKALIFNYQQDQFNPIKEIKATELTKISSSNKSSLSGKYLLIQISGDANKKSQTELKTYSPKIYLTSDKTNPFLTLEYVDLHLNKLEIQSSETAVVQDQIQNNNPVNELSDVTEPLKTVSPLALPDASEQSVKNYEYLLVEASGVASNEEAANLSSDQNTRNCKCSINSDANESVFDDACQLYSLNKTNNLYSIGINWNTKLKIDNLENSTLYVLKIDSSKYASLNQLTKQIKLVNKDQTKEFATFTEKKKLTQNDSKLKTNLILAKVRQVGNQSITDEAVGFKCKSINSEDKVACKVWTFSGNLTESHSQTDINQSTITKITSSNSNSLKNKHVLIEISGDENIKSEEELKSYLSEIFINENESNFFLKAEYVDSYIGSINQTELTQSSLVKMERSERDYLIVAVKDVTSTNAPTDTFNNSGHKNYKCKWSSDGSKDEYCSLVEIDHQGEWVTNMKNITLSNKFATKFEKQKYYKLFSNNQNFMSQTWNENSEITIESDEISSQPTKNYGTVIVVGKSVNKTIRGQTRWFISKLQTELTTSSTAQITFQCQFLGESNHSSCEIYNGMSGFTNFTADSLELNGFKKITDKEKMAKDKIVLVKLSNQKPINEWSSKTINVKVVNDSNSSVVLDVISPSFSYSENNGLIKEIPIILN